MWKSRDIALVILFAVISFIYSFFVGQLADLLTGIFGLNYLLIFGHATIISSALLVYKGKRWSLFFQGALVLLLVLPTHQGGLPFDVLARTPILVNTLLGDIIYNSVYKFFKKRNLLVWWATLCVTVFFVISPFLFMLNLYLFYPTEALTTFMELALLMLPVIIIESIIGGYFGYKVYERVIQAGWIKTNS
jgi:hypothetical protein